MPITFKEFVLFSMLTDAQKKELAEDFALQTLTEEEFYTTKVTSQTALDTWYSKQKAPERILNKAKVKKVQP